MNDEPLMEARSPRALAPVEWRLSEWRFFHNGPSTSALTCAFPIIIIFFPLLPDRFSVLWLLIKREEVAPEVRTAVMIFQRCFF